MTLRVENHGSIVLLRPLDEDARTWLDEHLDPDGQSWGGAKAVRRIYDPLRLASRLHTPMKLLLISIAWTACAIALLAIAIGQWEASTRELTMVLLAYLGLDRIGDEIALGKIVREKPQ
jgi:hypothetical protein